MGKFRTQCQGFKNLLSLLNRRYGVPLIDGGTVRLPAVVGHGRAIHLAMTGERIECDEAERIGLITKVTWGWRVFFDDK